jgi:DNA-binding CsgD family transcriptional regulator
MSRSAEGLYGRSAELERIDRFLAQLQHGGEALLVYGQPGVGKSVLLHVAAERAEAAGMKVLRATGSEFEADISYSCLNQLLLNDIGEIDALQPPMREALSVALGLCAGPVPDRLIVANATLALLRAMARERPVMVLVDDLQWVDRGSALVLGFVARRVAGACVAFVGVYRSGTQAFFDRAGLAEVKVGPLDETAAAKLLDDRYPTLAASIRQRVLEDSQGNPLALVELPLALSGSKGAVVGGLPRVLPLSDRLRAMFAARVSVLPEETLHLLLIAVFDGSGDLKVLRAALDAPERVADLAPAERARLIHVDESTARLNFRHPLMRSALVEISTHEQRRRAHSALAKALSGQPEQRAWHLAEATIGVDESVAVLLEQAAYQMVSRGDGRGAASALVRAAQLSLSDRDRARRLAEAAYIGAETTGNLRDAQALLADARRADPLQARSLPATCAAVFLMLNSDGDVQIAHRLLVGAIEAGDHGYRGDDPGLIEALHNLALLCWYGSQPELWEPFYRALDRMTPQPPALLALLRLTFADPARTASRALGAADDMLAAVRGESDPNRGIRTGTACVYIDRLAELRDGHWALVQESRTGTPNRRHVGAYMHLCLDDFLTGRWDEGKQLADEGRALCQHNGFPFFEWYFIYNQAIFAAGSGRFDEAVRLADHLSSWAAPRGVRVAQLWAHHPRTLVAMGQGDFETAFRHASEISPAGVLASHVPHSLWLMLDLVEAAVRTGRHMEAIAHARAIQDADIGAISPRMTLTQNACAALAVNGDGSGELFEAGLAAVAGQRWRYDEARVRLAYGEWLRRMKALTPAREQLELARDLFEHMGASPWVGRASAELRAAGVRLPQPEQAADALTAQELEIAMLAAMGLTNKEIAERLYLSPRTVSTHLYRIFPKLGITSRAALRDALNAIPTETTSRTPSESLIRHRLTRGLLGEGRARSAQGSPIATNAGQMGHLPGRTADKSAWCGRSDATCCADIQSAF